MLPLRATIKTAADLPVEALKSSHLLGAMTSTGSRVNVVILDDCRDLPFPSLKRSSIRGLARIENAESALLAFATASGYTASDGRHRNSPYTEQLLKLIKKLGIPLSQLFNNVGYAVRTATNGDQVPWTNSFPMPPNIYLGGNKNTEELAEQ